MTIQTQRWQPDTCGCVLIREYNTDTDIFSLKQYEIICAQHSSIANDNQRYLTMKENNERKNKVWGAALSQFSSILGQTDPETGGIVLKSGVKINWSFSGDGESRILNISFTGVTLTTQQKTTLQNLANTQFGSGKVVVS